MQEPGPAIHTGGDSTPALFALDGKAWYMSDVAMTFVVPAGNFNQVLGFSFQVADPGDQQQRWLKEQPEGQEVSFTKDSLGREAEENLCSKPGRSALPGRSVWFRGKSSQRGLLLRSEREREFERRTWDGARCRRQQDHS